MSNFEGFAPPETLPKHSKLKDEDEDNALRNRIERLKKMEENRKMENQKIYEKSELQA